MNKHMLALSLFCGTLFASASALAITQTFNGAGTPVAIPDAGNVNTTASAAGPGSPTNITDVNLNVTITHTWAEDVDITLASSNPVVAATPIIQDCGTNGDWTGTNVTFDDQGATPVTCATATNIAGNGPSPLGATVMAAFNGSATAGALSWTLNVADDDAICTGTLNSWSVTVTADEPLPAELTKFSID
ncbi:MAG: hypothetical protein JNN30_18310 [Rhodanobacteraceae bacterium]|nr:hypothetical protein [Rhodanobacteraceae bacterium]